MGQFYSFKSIKEQEQSLVSPQMDLDWIKIRAKEKIKQKQEKESKSKSNLSDKI